MTEQANLPNEVVTAFACRIGLEPHAEPSGKLIFSLIAPVRADRSRKTGPMITRLEITRKEIRLVTKAPLTAEEHAAIADACSEFDRAVGDLSPQQAQPPGDTVAP